MFADKRFLGLFEDLHRAGRPCVLASVVRTEGSSYRKAGAAMLIDPGYGFQGLISGGCFEADLEHYAREVFAQRRARWVTYDLRGEDELVWGLGLGCNGLIELWLQPFFAEDGYGALGAAHALAVEGRRGRIVRLLAQEGPGGFLRLDDRGVVSGEIDGTLGQAAEAALSSGAPGLREAAGARLFVEAVEPPFRLLILGAGPDVAPLVGIGEVQGWRTTVCDHRPGFVEQIAADDKRSVDPERLAEEVALDRFDAVVVMSHHYLSDRAYLAALAGAPIPYVGVLGPKQRTTQLLDEIGSGAEAAFAGRLYNPVGLDLGGDSPEAIALAVAAEILAVRSRARPAFMRDKDAPIHPVPGS